MYKKILVPFDNGDKSLKALDMAIGLAKNFKASITIFASINISGFTLNFTSGFEPALVEDLEKRTQKLMETAINAAAEKARKEGITVNTEISYGIPGVAIVKYADKEDINLIVMGSNNRRGFDRVMLGSVSNFVLHQAHCPVLIVKD
ncbi:MAG: putative universal stress protein [Pelotomaculum sp. PtaB.Bin104]|nr:MAG: putative universal stress protein [Pelotomaculum sp. PtaB.Bin104]